MILVVKDILAGIFDPNLLLSQLGRIQSESKEILREALKNYLQESGLRFQNMRAGNDQHLPSKHLQPLVGDTVLYLYSDDKASYGLIKEIPTKNRVTVKTQLHGIPMHSRLLSLLFRGSEWLNDLPFETLPKLQGTKTPII